MLLVAWYSTIMTILVSQRRMMRRIMDRRSMISMIMNTEVMLRKAVGAEIGKDGKWKLSMSGSCHHR